MASPYSDLRAELAEVGVRRFTASDYRPGTVRHLVLFRLKSGVSDEDRAAVTRKFLALATTLREGRPYISSIESGEQLSGEEPNNSFELGFIVSFESLGDRNFYVGEPIVDDPNFFDTEHAAFKKFVGPLLEAVEVFDFVAGGSTA